MNRLLRRGATMVAATMTAALLLPAAGAQAATSITPCDNEVTPTASEIVIPVLNIGNVIVHLNTMDDVYVQFDGPGEPLDTEVGADVQTINAIGDHDTVCILLPGVGGVWITVDLVPLNVEVCFFSGQPWTGNGCLL